jgi:hypothetical protein
VAGQECVSEQGRCMRATHDGFACVPVVLPNNDDGASVSVSVSSPTNTTLPISSLSVASC